MKTKLILFTLSFFSIYSFGQPTFTYTPNISDLSFNSLTLKYNMDMSGVFYYVLLSDGANPPSSVQVKNGMYANYNPASLSGNQNINTPLVDYYSTISGLLPGTSYDIYIVASDLPGILQISPTKIDITTFYTSACNIVALSDKDVICNGDSVNLYAFGVCDSNLSFTDFNMASLPANWTSNTNWNFTNPCTPSPDGTTFLWKGGTTLYPLHITTNSFDVSMGAVINFELRMPPNSTTSICDGPDLNDEGIHISYSIDGGLNFYDMDYIDPTIVNNDWNSYSVLVPPAAQTTSTIFRWSQLVNSGPSFDHWGLDNIAINAQTQNIQWSHGPDIAHPPPVHPSTDTIFYVTITNNMGISKHDSVHIRVSNILANAGSDTTITNGNSITLNGTASGGIAPYDYLWSPVTGLNNPAINNPLASPTNTTTYTLNVSDSYNCSNSNDVIISVVIAPVFDLGGNVFAGSFPVDAGKAYLYSNNAGIISPVDSMTIDTLGYFTFYQKPLNNYIVKVELDPQSSLFGQYLPVYFGDVANWLNASTINLNANVWDVNINMIQLPGYNSGPGSISGNIIEGGKFSGKGNTDEDVEIVLMDVNHNIFDCTVSGSSGVFNFDNMEYGTYNLYAEITGTNTYYYTITIDASNPDAVTDLNLSSDDLTKLATNVSDVYPNPAKSSVFIDLAMDKSTQINISIFNYTGQLKYSTEKNLGKGNQKIEINTDDMTSGIYYVILSTNDSESVIRKFIKIN